MCSDQVLPVRPGVLDGVTIMRYAHIYRERSSGGVEQYLRQLDQGLLQRHRMTVLQTHLVKDGEKDSIETEDVGRGRILWVPVAVRQAGSPLTDLPRRVGYLYRQALRVSRQEGEGRTHAMSAFVQSLLRHHGGHLRFEVTILTDRLPKLLETHNVDLLALHWLSYETGALITRAREAGVPYVFTNHFDNARWSLPGIRGCITHSAGIGTVSDKSVPDDLRDRCVNLSDAVDTDFFCREKARPVGPPTVPVVLLPARIQAGKGHGDLIQAAGILIARGIDLVVCFAGAVDSELLHQELRRAGAAKGLEGRIRFLGEVSKEQIRDWYARSAVVVLPSYSEGLPRVVLEAQAMETPVVAYDGGGTSKALLPNDTGLLVEAGNVDALADKIGFLLGAGPERRRMGQNGRNFVSRQFSVAALIQRHEAFYLRALSGWVVTQKNEYVT